MWSTLGWILITAIPAFVMSWMGTNYNKQADQHRSSEAPPPKPYWEPEDMFRPSRYTPEGNKWRKKAAFWIYGAPLIWLMTVFALAYLW